jgi:dTDP-4-amino-4,6-dideoxygalactose transaminase
MLRPMRDDYLVFGQPLIGQAEIDEIADSIHTGWVGSGPKVQRFERDLSAYIGAPHVRALASCTAGLMLSMHVLGVGAGDEVIVPTMTFAATANAVEHAGATPVFVDSVPGTGLIDFDAVEAAITPATKVMMPVHLWGRPLDMGRVGEIRERHGVAIVEDAAHALGAEWHGERIGTHGNLAVYSFYVTKNITTVEGGAVVTQSAELAERIEHLALHGLSRGAWSRFSDAGYKHYEVVEPGFKYNMTDLQAAIGVHQLPRLDGWIAVREQQWQRYEDELASLPLSLPPGDEPDTRHARHLFTIEVDADSPVSRDELLQRLHARKIGAGVHYRAVHVHPFYRDKYGLAPEAFPVALGISDRTLSLPLSPKVTPADQTDVIDALRSALEDPS